MRFLALAMCASLVAATLFAVPQGVVAPPPRPGAYLDQVTWFNQPNQAQAILDLQAGLMDMYAYQLRTLTDIGSAKSNPNLVTIDTDGSVNNLFLNPVPTNQVLAPGKINPFSSREVREAINYLVDRDYLANTVLLGAAHPHTTLWWPRGPDYARECCFMSELERRYAANLTKAIDLIQVGMTSLGATYSAGQWWYNGTVVNINLVQRTEDYRFDMGNYVRDRLVVAGFTVTLIPRTGGGAFAIVYNGLPDRACSGCADGGAWHAYTEGWGYNAQTDWRDGDAQFYFNGGEGSAVWGYYDPSSFPPGSLERQMADVASWLNAANYTSLPERQQLIRAAAELTLRNSVRVWLVTGATFVWSNRVGGFVYDLAGAMRGFPSVRTARFGAIGGNLQVGERLMFVSVWNPWRGFGWPDDAMQAYAFIDPALWTHPHSGRREPVRADFDVTTAGPSGNLPIPSDALLWDNGAMAFQPVGVGVTATSRATFNFTFGKWHHGYDITINDVLYAISLMGRSAPGGDIFAQDADAQSSAAAVFNQVVRGVKALDADTLEVYGDFWHPDAGMIAAALAAQSNTAFSGMSGVFPAVPWEVGELAMAPVLDGFLDVSEDTAAAEGVDALDLTKGASLGYMDRELTNLSAANWIPPGFGGLITPFDASNRWAALNAWRLAHGHFFVSSGPFYLDSVDTLIPRTTMRVVSLASLGYDYPWGSDRWDAWLVPQVPSVTIPPPPIVVSGTPASIPVQTSLFAVPYDDLDMCWQLIDPATGNAMFNGTAVNIGPGTWSVLMTAAQTTSLLPGDYTLRTGTTGHNASVPVFMEVTVTVTAGSGYPSVTVNQPLAGDVVRGGAATTISFNLSDPDNSNNNLIVWVNYSTDGGATYNPVPGAQGIPGTANPNTVPWTPPLVDTGTAIVKVDVEDPVENFDTGGSGLFTIDSTPPTVAITSHTDGQWVNNGAPTLAGTAGDTVGLASVEVSCDGGATWNGASGTSSWSFAGCILSGGPNAIRARAFDLAGLESPPAVLTLNLDANAPTVVITSPLDGAWLNTSSFLVTGTADDTGGSGLDRVEVTCDAGATWTVATGTTSWSHLCSGLAETSYTFGANAYDTAGGRGFFNILVHVDLNAPTVTIASPLDGSTVTSSSVTVSGSAADPGPAPSGLDRVEVSCDGGATWVPATGTTSWTHSPCTLAVGPNTIRARAFDMAGWASADDVITVTYVVPAAPTVTITDPTDSTWHQGGAGVFIAYDLQDADSTAAQLGVWVNYSFDNVVWTPVTGCDGVAPAVEPGSNTCAWTTPSVDDLTVWVRVEVVDEGGRSAVDVAPITLDSTGPTITVTSPLDNAWFGTASPSVTVSGTASDNFLVDSIEVSFDGGSTWVIASCPTCPGLSVSWSVTGPTTLTPGANPYRIHAVAHDPAWHDSTHALLSLNYDDAVPTVVITSPSDGATVNAATVGVQGTAADAGSGLDRVEVSCDGGATYTPATGGATWTFTCTFTEGTHTIHAKSVDSVGRESVHAIATVTYAQTPDLSVGPSVADWWWLIVLLLVAAAVVALFFMLRRRKEKELAAEEAPAAPPESPPPSAAAPAVSPAAAPPPAPAALAVEAPETPEREPIARGYSYLVVSSTPTTAYQWFNDLVRRGIAGLVFSTTFQEKVQKDFGLQGGQFFWVTDAASGPDVIDPHRLEFEIVRTIGNFVREHPGGVILLHGVEYLSVTNGFDRVLTFIKKVNDMCAPNHVTLLVPLAPAALTTEQRGKLAGSFDRVEQVD